MDFLEYLCFKENQRLLNYIFPWCAAGSFQALCLMVKMLFKIPFFKWGVGGGGGLGGGIYPHVNFNDLPFFLFQSAYNFS